MTESTCKVVVVFSNKTIKNIQNFIKDYLDVTDGFELARIERYRTKNGKYKESNRTLFLMSSELYDKAIQHELHKSNKFDFRLEEYKLTDRHLPNKNQNGNIFLSIPKDIDYECIELQIKNKLNIMKNYGLINYDYNLFIPLKSRETGEHKGIGYINFTDDDLETKTLVKLLLQDTRLYNDKNEERYYLKTFWVNKK